MFAPFLILAVACSGQIHFADVTLEAGLTFRHWDGGCGHHYFAEQVGGGAAFFDQDGDARLDLFLCSGVALGACPGSPSGTSKLFRQEAPGRFVDATSVAGLASLPHVIGCVVGDIDNDADDDLFLSCLGRDVLLRNDGGRFTDVTTAAGVEDASFGASAAFLDHDRDGDLDLYVTNYVELPPIAVEKPCQRGALEVYCQPQDFPAQADKLYRNDGSGGFTDVTHQAGVHDSRARGLGVVVGDFDDDGDPDLYVANDANLNQLFYNADGKFVERALEAGVALSENGSMENGMGTDCGDFDGDARLDLVVTNFDAQVNTLYRNLGGGAFSDVSFASGIGAPSLPHVGWGAIFADLDLDGRLDLVVTQGHVFDNVEKFQQAASFAQPLLVHRNSGKGVFSTLKLDAANGFPPRVGRGAAAGDYDDDGDPDLVVNNLNDAPFLLRNETPRPGSWFGLRLVGSKSNRSAIGARVTAKVNGATLLREVKAGSGYLSHNDTRIVLGLGQAVKPDSVIVRWPSGVVDDVTAQVVLARYVRVIER